MARSTVRFEVKGLAFWAYDEERYPEGVHEIEADEELRNAVSDAANANVGVHLLDKED